MSSNTREGWTWPSGVAKGGSEIFKLYCTVNQNLEAERWVLITDAKQNDVKMHSEFNELN